MNKSDAMAVAPDLHAIIFENDVVRILKVTVPKNAHADMHWHPANMNYVIKGGSLRFGKKDGTFTDMALEAGQVTSAETDVWHSVDNIGSSEVQTIQVEFKNLG